jgi:hypothetical protein
MKKIILLPIILLLFVALVSGVKPTQTNIVNAKADGQLIILQPEIEVFTQYDDVELHFHILNASASILNSSNKEVNCSIHIYNSSNDHIYESFMDADDLDMSVRINTNLTDLYTFNMWCWSPSGAKGTANSYGYISSYYYVTQEGKHYRPGVDSKTSYVIILGVFAVCFLLLYASFKLDKDKHFILQLIILIFVMVVMILIPKTVLDFADDFATAGIFYKATLWFIRVFWLYMAFYLLSEMFAPLKRLRVRLK